jgi:hypothetical protein
MTSTVSRTVSTRWLSWAVAVAVACSPGASAVPEASRTPQASMSKLSPIVQTCTDTWVIGTSPMFDTVIVATMSSPLPYAALSNDAVTA